MTQTTVENKTKTTARNWMEAILDTTTWDRMSLPGTHESCALYDKATGGKTQCQNLSITEQLERGIRFLDIRCKYKSDDDPTVFFPIHHGNIYQNITFSRVQEQCIDFLQANPTEFIFMNVQQEEHWYASDYHYVVDGKTFGDKFSELIAPSRSWWLLPDEQRVYTVESSRKHIILIRTYDETSSKGWWIGDNPEHSPGLAWNGFDIDGLSKSQLFETQNGWNAWYGTEKGKQVKHYLDLASNQAGSAKIYLNFLSHTNGTPGNNAQDMNPMIHDYITGIDYRKPLGILPIDFCSNTGQPGTGCLEDVIIEHNPYKSGFEYY